MQAYNITTLEFTTGELTQYIKTNYKASGHQILITDNAEIKVEVQSEKGDWHLLGTFSEPVNSFIGWYKNLKLTASAACRAQYNGGEL